MQATLDSTAYKREKQMAYNQAHNITPTQIKIAGKCLNQAPTALICCRQINTNCAEVLRIAMTRPEIEKIETRKAMKQQPRIWFYTVTRYRDQMTELQKQLETAKVKIRKFYGFTKNFQLFSTDYPLFSLLKPHQFSIFVQPQKHYL